MARDPAKRPAWFGYAVSLTVFFIAALVRWQLSGILGFRGNFVTFYPAVTVAALHGGLRLGLLATIVSATLANLFWIEPSGIFGIPRGNDLLDIILFILGGILISYLVEMVNRGQARAYEAEQQLQFAAEREKTQKERKRLIQVRLDLIAYAVTHTTDELLSKALDEIGEIVESPIGFYQFVERDEKSVSLQQWSTRTLGTFCKAGYRGSHYSIEEAGVWADCIRERRPIIHNDYDSLENRKGLPEGHPKVVRELVVPVLREGRIVAVVGVGNKEADYTEKDAETLTYLSDVTWEIIERKRDEETIRQNEITLRTVLNQLPSGVAVRDVGTGALIFSNVKGREIAGTLADEVSQFPPYRFFYPDGRQYRAEEWPFFRSLTTGERIDGEELEYERADGVRLTISISCAPVRDSQGQLVMSACVFNDITERKMAEEALREREELLDLFIRHAPASLAMFDREMRYLAFSQRWLSDHNLGDRDLAGLSHYEVFPEIPERWRQAHRRALAGEVLRAESDVFRRADGSIRWVKWEVRPWRTVKGDVAGILIFSEDITELTRRAEELRSANRALQALSNTVQAIIHAAEESELLQSVCRIIVEDCGYQMAWIGFAQDDENKTVTPVAQAGFEEGYLQTVKITWADTEAGRGPTGTAIRTGAPDVCCNFFTDPRMRPWRDEAVKRGFVCSLALPLRNSRGVHGALTIYSKEPDAFSEPEVALLARLADELAYGISALKLHNAHRVSEENLRESRARLDLALRSAGMGTWHWDIVENRRYFDDQACFLLGIDPKTFTGREEEFFGVLDPEDLETVRTALSRTLEKDVPYNPVYRVKREGEIHHIAARGKLTRDESGRPARLNGLIWDITERVRMVEELRRSRDELDVRVRERTAELQRANEELRKMAQLKSTFLANMSHELRTPMNVIIGYTDLLIDGVDGPVNEEQAKSLKKIASNSRYLLQLINDVLDLSRIESGKMRLSFKEIDLAWLIESTAADFEPLLKQKGLGVTCHVDESVRRVVGDEGAIRQILNNLLSNALKFTQEGGITITATNSARGVESGAPPLFAEICVEDSGIGIREEDLGTIFDKFVQVNHITARRYESTGLGLSIARGLTSLHKGMIWATSVYGKGSRFCFTIPLTKEILERPGEPVVEQRMATALGRCFGQPIETFLRNPEYGGKNVRCWHYVRCGQPSCPAYGSEESRCWLILGTHCAGMKISSYPEKVDFCKGCELIEKIVLKGDEELIAPGSEEPLKIDSGSRRVVLAIDDNPDGIEIIRKYLGEGYSVIGLLSGEKAVEKARELKPVAITLDILMPGMDGWEVLRELKQNPETEDIPVMIVSILDERRLGFSLGAAEYAVKPVAKDVLLKKLQNLERGSRITRILIVESELETARLIGNTLKEAGYEVLTSYNSEDAIRSIQEFKPQLIVLRMNMPQMSGFDVVEFLQVSRDARDMLLIVLTSGDFTEEESRAWNGRIQTILDKRELGEGELSEKLTDAILRVR